MTRLSDSLMPLFAYARQLTQHPRGEAAEAAMWLDAQIESARAHAARAGIDDTDVDDALFAACAWIDEAVLNSRWAQAAHWTPHLLQQRYFDTSHAGVGFFERLEALDATRAPVLEIYLLCLRLGFRGRYGYDPDGQPLDAILRRTLDKLGVDASADGEPPFPAAYAGGESPDAARRARTRRRLARAGLDFGLPLAILLSIGLLYHVVILHMVDSTLSKLR
ncbi:DotU family type IV/VI secretion system protein [Burkholderia alba]|uniref:DotU family type IV/VI secretion system protein n=1 Tax=Burkholderia alba TaxID=2683677 RepID=UPI002B059BDE|nr:DotU family type IV/VI secretion system protein [Burkholderia alba]